MNRNLIFAIVVSLLIHVGIVSCNQMVKKGSTTAGTEQGGNADAPVVISAYIENANVMKNEGKGTGPSALTDLCTSKKFYTGIGVIMGLNGSVSSVALGGPADKAGIKVGDIISNSSILQPDKHPVGTQLPLQIVRPHQNLTIIVSVDKVCFDDK